MVSFKTLFKCCYFHLTLTDSLTNKAAVTVSGGCANVQLDQASYSGSPTIPEKKWTQTPSVVHIDKSEYFYIMSFNKSKEESFISVHHFLKTVKSQLTTEGQKKLCFQKFNYYRNLKYV